jgi:uncharacterized membrane protein
MHERTPIILLFLLLALVALHIDYYSSRLPATVASHFDGSGTPNGWMSREAFLGLYGMLVVVLVIPFALFGVLLKAIPERWVNLPHKAHWLHPSRRAQTYKYLQQWGFWFGDAVIAFMIALMHLVIRANLVPAGRLSPAVWLLLATLIGLSVGMTVALFIRFRRPEPMGP